MLSKRWHLAQARLWWIGGLMLEKDLVRGIKKRIKELESLEFGYSKFSSDYMEIRDAKIEALKDVLCFIKTGSMSAEWLTEYASD